MSNRCLLNCCNLSVDTTDEEAKSQFLEEIEIMKAIGSHKNIVSMLGCWVQSDPIFLMLEYVRYGDLQHWLRNKRIQVDFTLIRTLCERNSDSHDLLHIADRAGIEFGTLTCG